MASNNSTYSKNEPNLNLIKKKSSKPYFSNSNVEIDDYNPDDFNDQSYQDDENIYSGCTYEENFQDLTNEKNFQIVHLNEISNLRENLISKCCESTALTRDEAILVLIQYKWNIDRIDDDWFNDVDENRQKFGIDLDKPSKLKLLKLNVNNYSNICLVCESNLEESDNFSLKCGHNLCNFCWTEFIKSKIDDIFCCVYSTCPQQGCNIKIPESVFLKFMTKDYKEKYDKIVLKNFTENNTDIRWCPSDCGCCVSSEEHSNKEITCDCKYVFCFSCLREGHKPCFCEMMAAWEKKNNSEGENVKWLLVNTKKCPSCHRHIEKNQGCNHMTCRKEVGGCGYEFCWICMSEWKTHNDFYKCNKFGKEKDEENKILDTEKEKLKHELDKYIFNFDRYITHKKSKELCKGMKEVIKNHISQLNKQYNISFADNQFLEDGLKTVEKGRRTLMNVYVFGFYLKTNSKHRNLYEYNQQFLEKNCDFLQECLENQSLEKIINIKDFGEFNKEYTKYKALITDYSSATNKYIDNLIYEIETNMIEDVELKK